MALLVPRGARGAVLAGLFISCFAGKSIETAAAGDWTITPFISGQETFTDNVLLTPTNRHSDFVTGLSPGISITGESARFSANLNYSPILQLFALTPNQNFLGHSSLFSSQAETFVGAYPRGCLWWVNGRVVGYHGRPRGYAPTKVSATSSKDLPV